MALNLRLKQPSSIPLHVEAINPEYICDKGFEEIKVHMGNRAVKINTVFDVSGSANDDKTICFTGDLRNVNGIGSVMTTGTIQVTGDAGALVGERMSGGRIEIQGNVGDYLGAQMTGGEIVVNGNAGDYVGANRPGFPYGMNRGTIHVRGSVGQSLGRRMRRGTIIVEQAVGALLGWEMLAGTIVVFGKMGRHAGLDMKRGTIIFADADAASSTTQLPTTFSTGTTWHCQTIALFAAWLRNSPIEIESRYIQRLVDHKFLQLHGDINEGGRGEIFLVQPTSAAPAT